MIKKTVAKFVRDFKKLPERKQYIEFFTALLSVPVLLTVLLLNLTNLRTDKESETKDEQPVREIIITQPSEKESSNVVRVTEEPCIEEIGPISIDNPSDNETVTDNPVQVSIIYKKGNYCAVVWSYRVNNGTWSDYDDNSVALFNLPQGTVKFDLRVKSLVSGDEKNLSRTFTYRGNSVVPTDEPASGSAN